jgi:hypothetical protein
LPGAAGTWAFGREIGKSLYVLVGILREFLKIFLDNWLGEAAKWGFRLG